MEINGRQASTHQLFQAVEITGTILSAHRLGDHCSRKERNSMRISTVVLGLSSSLAVLGGSLILPTTASADSVERTYVACNQYGDCWRVHQRYSYPSDEKIVIHDNDWYAAHQSDEHVHWRNDPADDRGWYERDGNWHGDPGVRAMKGGMAGAGVGAAIGCLATLPVGCAPGAAVGAAVGGGTGVVAGAASTPHD